MSCTCASSTSFSKVEVFLGFKKFLDLVSLEGGAEEAEGGGEMEQTSPRLSTSSADVETLRRSLLQAEARLKHREHENAEATTIHKEQLRKARTDLAEAIQMQRETQKLLMQQIEDSRAVHGKIERRREEARAALIDAQTRADALVARASAAEQGMQEAMSELASTKMISDAYHEECGTLRAALKDNELTFRNEILELKVQKQVCLAAASATTRSRVETARPFFLQYSLFPC
jgi:chromosome segregation ATPase